MQKNFCSPGAAICLDNADRLGYCRYKFFCEVLELSRSIVTLTTDFGTSDYYVGVMKGVILSVNPDAEIVDICHDIRAYDVLEGALAIAQAYSYFPLGAIHLVVVDPGVGSARRPLLVGTSKHFFIAPDNGVLSLIYAREPDILVRHITASHYYLEPISQTFHGRDIFAPVAGWLSRRVDPDKFGDPIGDFARFAPPQPKRINERLLKGVVLRVDRFGTLLTNFTASDVPQLFGENPPPFKIIVGKAEVTQIKQNYSQGVPGEIFAVLGSAGYLEIAANRASAAQVLGVGKGAEVGVVLG
ncbi:MAG: SAM-dependent chlorinase/fluorinase [Acidobacteria bacterium]|nr:SAM-dependent chlorinase/fluorinase [Acidobacteriota bacterium]